MSKRNSQEAKRAARERLRVEREKQAKKDRMRRQLGVAAAVVGTLVVVAGIGFAVTKMMEEENPEWNDAQKVAEGESSAGRYASYEAPANTGGKDGVDIVIGEKDAKNTLTIYEDMRCPSCAAFDQANGEMIAKGIEDGTYKAEFVFGTFLDKGGEGGGVGSRNALSALGAALNVSPEAFLEYQHLLYAKGTHPNPGEDKFGDDDALLEVADGVKELKGNNKFEKAVKDGTFDPWAIKTSKKFDKAEDVTGTPALKVNGKMVQTPEGGAPMGPEQFKQLVDPELKK